MKRGRVVALALALAVIGGGAGVREAIDLDCPTGVEILTAPDDGTVTACAEAGFYTR